MSRTTTRFAATLIVAAGTLSAIAPKSLAVSATAPGPASVPAGGAATPASAHPPMRFEVNAGQFGTGADFVASAGGTTLAISAGELALTLQSQPPAPSRSPASQSQRSPRPTGPTAPGTVSTVHLKLVGAANVRGQGVGQLPGVSNYLFGNDPSKWHVGVHAYAAVRYNGVWPGIDLIVRSGAASPEYDFEVAPGADPGRIKLAASGGPAHLDESGDLLVDTPAGPLRQRAPHLSQKAGGTDKPVTGGFALHPDGSVGFSVGAHDPTLPLTIDPELVYSTLLGGPITTDIPDGEGMALAVTADAAGDAYVTGFTQSPLFPVSAGALQTAFLGQDLVAYVTKLSSDGSSLIYSTYLAGNSYRDAAGVLENTIQKGTGIAVDATGRAAIAGYTTAPDFPTTQATAFEPTPTADLFAVDPITGHKADNFVTVLNSSGTGLAYSTYLGSQGLSGDVLFNDHSYEALSVDTAGDLYVVGGTATTTFPTTPAALQPTCQCDATFANGQSTSGSPAYSSASAAFGSADVGLVVTGVNIPAGTTIAAVVSLTQVQLSNPASASGAALPFTIHNRTHMAQAMVASKLDPSKSGDASLVYSTYVGETTLSAFSQAHAALRGVAVDPAGDAYVSGTADDVGFPTTPGAFRPGCGCNGTFSDGVTTAGSTVLNSASASFVAGDAGKQIIGSGVQALTTVASVVSPTQIQLSQPATASGAAATFTIVDRAGAGRAFAVVAQLNPAGSSLAYSTYLGPTGTRTAIAIDPGGNAYVSGRVTSSSYPTTPGAFQTTIQGGSMAFVTKVNASGTGLVYSSLLGGSSGTDYAGDYHGQDVVGGIGVDHAGRAYVTGSTFSQDFPSVDPITPANPCCLGVFVSEFAPDGASVVFSTEFEGSEGTAVAVDPNGAVYVVGQSYTEDDFSLVTPGAFQAETPDNDAFVLKLVPTAPGTARVTAVTPTSGPRSGGTVVQIAGTGLTAAAGVTFGGVSAVSFVIHSDTSITAVSPPQSTAVETARVRVTTTAGTSPGNPPSYFTYGSGSWAMTGPIPSPHGGNGLFPANGPIDGRFLSLKHAAVRLADGRVFLAGGLDNNGNVTSAVAIYDPTAGTWTAAAPLDSCAPDPACSARAGQTTTVLQSGKVLVAGGSDTSGNTLATVEVYDPIANAWSPAAPMNRPRILHTATLLPNGLVLVAAGGGGGATAELYDPANNSWSFVGSMANPREDHTATVLTNGTVLVAGGDATGTSAELFDPVRRTWSVTGSLGEAHRGAGDVLLHDGTVLVVGGVGVKSMERYDPASGTWSLAGELRYQHDKAVATVLDNGEVLVINGNMFVSWTLPELIDPASGFQSESAGALPDPRTDSGAVVLTDGRVLVLGGGVPYSIVGFSSALAVTSADLYTPAPTVSAISPVSGSAAGGQAVVITGTGFNLGTTGVNFGGIPAASFHVDSPTQITAVSPAQAAGGVDVTVTTAGGASIAGPQDLFTVVVPPPPAPPPPAPPGVGYWLVASDGGIFPFGHAGGFGSTGNIRLNQPIVGMARTPDGHGYWLVAADGGIFPFGDAAGFGSTGAIRLNKPIVGMAATPDGGGYWMVASDGGIFPFGDARGFGSTGAIRLNKPIVGMAIAPDGGGYWLVASDGGIFPFGDARGFGSTGAIRLNKPIVGMAATPDGGGYWLVASDGGIFPFGDAQGFGSTGAIRLNKPMVGMATTRDAGGYWLVASDGGIFPFGDAEGFGSTGGIRLNRPIVGMAATASG